MSKTPRTDANRLVWDRNNEPGVSAKFAEGLELELNEANARIKLLIEAGDAMEANEWTEDVLAVAWRKAKKSK